MDIPLPEELEWLESNSLLPEETEEDEFYYPEDERIQKLPETNSPSLSSPSPTEKLDCRKRVRSEEEEEEEEEEANEEKRVRKSSQAEADEDWLRYSPPPKSPSNDLVVDQALVDPAGSVVVEEKILSRFASEIEGECIPVTGPDGDRVYAKVSRWETNHDTERSRVKIPPSGLLSESIRILIERADQEAFTKALTDSAEPSMDEARPAMSSIRGQLWVDKYAPNSFTELLSDEQTNREVLLWLKQWDSCVFGSQIRATADNVLSALRRHSSFSQNQKFSDSKSSFFSKSRSPWTIQTLEASDAFQQKIDGVKNTFGLSKGKSPRDNPRDQKVLLLCGPPGLGKTTLAYVAAKHCGYHVVEINASDDRSTSIVESKILDAIEMKSVLADAKPKCLVIDEIDGAQSEGKGAVEVILKLLASDKKSLGKDNITQEAHPGNLSSKKRANAATLSRPIICICNDLYAPALRQLRQVAKVHIFAQPTVSRVVARLKYICNKEGLKTSSIALTALAEYTECDIRSCLNTLQFLNMKRQPLNILEVGSQVVGRKDMSKSAFDVWKEIFQKRKTKREMSMHGIDCSTKDFNYIYSLISNRGDFELTMDGIHENFLKVHYHDPLMQKTVKCLNNLGVSDSFLQYTMRNQHMSLFVYQPSIAITVRSLISQVEKINIEWPRTFLRNRAIFMEKKEELKSWHSKIMPSIARHQLVESFVENTVSPLLRILSPPNLRPVAPHLLSEIEKNDLTQLVDTMVSYAITYKSLKQETKPGIQRHEAATDVPALTLDPRIGDFISFKDYYPAMSSELSLAMKQVLVHEIEKQKILRESGGKSGYPFDKCRPTTTAQPAVQSTEALAFETNYRAATYNMQNMKETISLRQGEAVVPKNSKLGANTNIGRKSNPPGNVQKRPCGPQNFFDRFRKSNSKSSNDHEDPPKAATSERDLRPLLFKFNEGFTNAIKRPVRIYELLP
ncbi:hypothetical protein H6P81_012310 [Aristolochia fimbriata]|uniref:Chromosome transmission fidelity protein 18 homolog n=1 Tax=Aristolochia fimbriata TaxID=158543 RepID=A0AAV7EBF6_ARIFI|nr:hypothetical protein H6P81_012310 [Aristolochia fimbriata]